MFVPAPRHTRLQQTGGRPNVTVVVHSLMHACMHMMHEPYLSRMQASLLASTWAQWSANLNLNGLPPGALLHLLLLTCGYGRAGGDGGCIGPGLLSDNHGGNARPRHQIIQSWTRSVVIQMHLLPPRCGCDYINCVYYIDVRVVDLGRSCRCTLNFAQLAFAYSAGPGWL